MTERLEDADEYISLARAGEVSGLSPVTLRNQALAGKLRTVKLARDLLTTRAWLHEYLMGRDASNRHSAPLPPDYVAPGQDAHAVDGRMAATPISSPRVPPQNAPQVPQEPHGPRYQRKPGRSAAARPAAHECD